jgi:hypothetical protein
MLARVSESYREDLERVNRSYLIVRVDGIKLRGHFVVHGFCDRAGSPNCFG